MATVVGLTIIKKFSYRGNPLEEYSNQYWLTGAVPASGTDWTTLAHAVGDAERAIFTPDVTITRAYGYDSDADDAVAVWSANWEGGSGEHPGTLVATADTRQAGDSAVWIRWTTARLNSKGKPIYLRKYFHPAMAKGNDLTNVDLVADNQRAGLNALGATMSDGSLPGGRTLRSQHHDESLQGHYASVYVTTRTLKRRGKRPSS